MLGARHVRRQRRWQGWGQDEADGSAPEDIRLRYRARLRILFRGKAAGARRPLARPSNMSMTSPATADRSSRSASSCWTRRWRTGLRVTDVHSTTMNAMPPPGWRCIGLLMKLKTCNTLAVRTASGSGEAGGAAGAAGSRGSSSRAPWCGFAAMAVLIENRASGPELNLAATRESPKLFVMKITEPCETFTYGHRAGLYNEL